MGAPKLVGPPADRCIRVDLAAGSWCSQSAVVGTLFSGMLLGQKGPGSAHDHISGNSHPTPGGGKEIQNKD